MQRSTISLAVLALWAGASSASASSESPSKGLPSLPRVEVTGTHILRVESEPSVPTLVITRKDIQATGLASVKQVIDSIVGSSQLQTGSNRNVSDLTGAYSYAAGSSAASLRHLGPQATLVLLNSRRLSSFAIHDDPGMFTDLDTLPLEAVERIEVLRSGASAIYGSDAIAGVINIITRKDFKGVTLRASQEQSTNTSDFRTSTASLSAGVGDWATDRFNVMLNVELYRRSAVSWGDVLGQVNPESTKYGFAVGARSRWSNPGNIDGVALAGCDPSQLEGTSCTYDKYRRLEAQPAADRGNLLLSGRLALAPDLEAFAEVLYGRSKTVYVMPDPTYDVETVISWFDPSSGQPRLFIGRGLPAGHPLNFTGQPEAPLTYRFTDADSHIQVQSTAYRTLAGLRGTRQGFDWQSALGLTGSTVRYGARGGYSDAGFKSLVGDYTLATDPQFFNRGYQIGGGNSAEVLDTLFPGHTQVGHMKQAFVDGRLSGPLGTLRGRTVDVALGFDLRHESLDLRPSDNLAQGDIVGWGSAQTQGARTFGSVFTEANLPLTDALQVQAAARLDKYPQFRTNISPKLGLRFEASRSLLVRGQVESGFRAPNLVESASTTLYSFDSPIADPKRCDAAGQLASQLQAEAAALPPGDPARAALETRALVVYSLECAGTSPAIRNSNAELKPEKSLGTTLGLVFSPSPRFVVEADYWRIVRRNEINFTSGQALVNAEDTLEAGRVQRLPLDANDRSFSPAEQALYGVTAGALSGTVSQYQNTAKTSAEGIDFGARGRLPTRWGVWSAALQASFLSHFHQYSTFKGDYGDNLAGRYGYPRWRAHMTTGLDSGAFSHALRLNFTGATKLQGDFYDQGWSDQECLDAGWSLNDCRVRPSYTFDYALAYTGVPQLTLALNVRNLFNTRPPVDQRAFHELGGAAIPQNLADVYRRTVRLSLEYRFL